MRGNNNDNFAKGLAVKTRGNYKQSLITGGVDIRPVLDSMYSGYETYCVLSENRKRIKPVFYEELLYYDQNEVNLDNTLFAIPFVWSKNGEKIIGMSFEIGSWSQTDKELGMVDLFAPRTRLEPELNIERNITSRELIERANALKQDVYDDLAVLNYSYFDSKSRIFGEKHIFEALKKYYL